MTITKEKYRNALARMIYNNATSKYKDQIPWLFLENATRDKYLAKADEEAKR